MIAIFCLAGVALGMFTGLAPGIHVNTVCIFLLSFSLGLDSLPLAVIVISMAITHTFFDFVPSILLGAPDPETALSVLPGHKMLFEGKAVEAIHLTLAGGVIAVVLAVLLSPLFIIGLPLLYAVVQPYIHVILMLILASMLYREKGKRAIFALYVFVLSGGLGLVTLYSHTVPGNFMLFPVFTGLFGLSTMILSLRSDSPIPRQDVKSGPLQHRMVLRGSVKGLFSGALVGTLPSLGSSEAAVLSHQFSRGKDNKEFIVSLGAVNTVVALFSIISLYTIDKARSGAAVAVQRLLPNFQLPELILLMGVTLIATSVSSFVLIRLAPWLVKNIHRIDYRKTTYGVIGLLIVLGFWFTGFPGLLVLFTSTFIGLLPPLLGIRRTFSMGVLMFPVILIYSGLL